MSIWVIVDLLCANRSLTIPSQSSAPRFTRTVAWIYDVIYRPPFRAMTWPIRDEHSRVLEIDMDRAMSLYETQG